MLKILDIYKTIHSNGYLKLCCKEIKAHTIPA